MKTSAPKLLLLLSSVAVFAFTASSTYAGEPSSDSDAQKRAEKREANALKKYDKNANGVLDPDEQAERQANIDRMRGVREAKKKKGDDKKARE